MWNLWLSNSDPERNWGASHRNAKVHARRQLLRYSRRARMRRPQLCQLRLRISALLLYRAMGLPLWRRSFDRVPGRLQLPTSSRTDHTDAGRDIGLL